jgi:type I restriction enzyme, S subunit
MRMWQGAVGVVPTDGLISPAYVVARPYPEVEPRYYAYLFRTVAYLQQVEIESRGIVPDRNRLYWDAFKQMSSVYPPLEEQRAIADYLDAHSRFVQRYERSRRYVTALLEDHRLRAVVSLVSGGLAGEATQRKQAVEWLGDVPDYWQVSALRHRYSVKLGKMLDAKRITGAHLLPYLRNVDVQWDRINTAELPQMDVEPHEYVLYTLSPGDLLVCEGGEVGRAAFWHGELERCAFQKALHRVRVLNVDRDNPRFLFYLLFAAAKLGVFLADGSENTIAHLTQEKLRAFRFPFPPKHEQDAIAAQLDRHGAQIDRATTRVESEVKLVREFRERLIADSVRGRIDLRGCAPLAPEIDGPALKDSGEDQFNSEALEDETSPFELEEVTSDAD